jgi:hypothetical protein
VKLIRTPPEFPKGPPPIKAQAVPSSDKILADVKEAKQRDQRKGTGPARNTPKPYVEDPGLDVAPDVAPKTEPNVDTGIREQLQSALHSVGTDLIQGHDDPTLAAVGFAFRRAAAQLGTGTEEPEDRGGLFNTPSPEREA